MLDTTGGGLLKSVEQLLSQVFIPTFKNMTHGWGELSSGPQAQSVKQDFISSLENFASVLAGAQESLEEKVTLLHTCSLYSSIDLVCSVKPISNLKTGIYEFIFHKVHFRPIYICTVKY